MILETLLNFIQSMIFGVFSWINLPEMPVDMEEGLYEFFELFEFGTSFLGFFIPGTVILPFFAIWALVFVLDHGYPIVMWIIRKIPFLGIE